MISLHPFNTWPLHVKIFTKEVADQWKAADADGRLPLPPGFTCSVELEGVDGQSGQRGSGRKGPISVDDGQCFPFYALHLCTYGPSCSSFTFPWLSLAEFTSEILSKSSKIVDSGRALDCSICHEPIEDFAMVGISKTTRPRDFYAYIYSGTYEVMSLSVFKLRSCQSSGMSLPSFHRRAA